LAKITGFITLAVIVVFFLYWFGQLTGCLARKDFRPVDKLFWFLVLLIPIIGLILYRGLGPEFYKSQPKS